MRICVSDLKIRPPAGPTDWCLELIKEPPKKAPEHRYFASKAFWFRMTHERDVESAYLQIALTEGLVRLMYKGRPIESVKEFKALVKSVNPAKYVVTHEETGWAGLMYQSMKPKVNRAKWCSSLEECAKYEGHLYKRPAKFVPQVLMGALKRYHGISLIDYVASIVNIKLRQVCAPHDQCIAHVHDGLVMSGGPGPRLPFEHKLEERVGWSWAGLVAPGDPPRYWGFQPNSIEDIIIINRILTEAESPEEAYKPLEPLCLWPEIFEKSIDQKLSGLVDLEQAIKALKADADLDYGFILDHIL
jgi:hypothetical protein